MELVSQLRQCFALGASLTTFLFCVILISFNLLSLVRVLIHFQSVFVHLLVHTSDRQKHSPCEVSPSVEQLTELEVRFVQNQCG